MVLAMDPDAWERFLALHGPFALGLATERLRRAGFGEGEAEEVVQEVWIVLLKGAARGLPEGRGPPLRAYLAAMVLNACRMWLRSGGRRSARELAYGLSSRASEVPDEPLLRAEETARLNAALARLSREDQLLLRWAYWEGLGYAAIGRLLGVSPDSVGPRLSRARQRLGDLLAPPRQKTDDPRHGAPLPRH